MLTDSHCLIISPAQRAQRNVLAGCDGLPLQRAFAVLVWALMFWLLPQFGMHRLSSDNKLNKQSRRYCHLR
jgi:hypothetical protein